MREVKVWNAGAVKMIARFAAPDVSRFATFDWSPDASELVFARDFNLYRYRSGVVARVGPEGVLRPLAPRPPEPVPWVNVRYSPSGELLAVSSPSQTGVFRRDGSLVRTFDGPFNGWAGNAGVLVLGFDADRVARLVLHPLDDGEPLSLVRRFKLGVISDPRGRWFSYVEWPNHLIFRRPDGSLLRRIHFASFVPAVFGAVSETGRLYSPVSVL